MEKLWKNSTVVCSHGEKYAEMKSVRGAFEGYVPSKLKSRIGKK